MISLITKTVETVVPGTIQTAIGQYGLIAFILLICGIVWWTSSIKSKLDTAVETIVKLVDGYKEFSEEQKDYKLEQAKVVAKIYSDLRQEIIEAIRQHKADCK